MSETIKIYGGKVLRGKVTPIPNKNSIISALPAAILTDKTIVFRNIPQTADVEKLLLIYKLLGAEIDDTDYSRLEINCRKIKSFEVNKIIGEQFRGSLMFVGPLLARFGKARIPAPGGCELGMRSIGSHVDSFTKAGVTVKYIEGFAEFTAPKNPEKIYDIWQLEASVTATENLCMYAAGTAAEFNIIDAACEPHVVDLLNLLKQMGANIEGSGSNRLKIKGARKLTAGEFIPGPDFVDIAGFIVAAAVTGGEITIEGANIPEIVTGLVNWFSLFNIQITKQGKDLVVSRKGKLEIDWKKNGVPLAAEGFPKLVPRPWPGFPVDVIPVMAVLASKARGKLLLQNWMYESGLDFVRELNSLGANIFMADPQRIIIHGPVKFTGGIVGSPKVIQACKAIFLAGLSDKATTVIHGVDILKRRYPNIFDVYRNLGAKLIQ